MAMKDRHGTVDKQNECHECGSVGCNNSNSMVHIGKLNGSVGYNNSNSMVS